MSLFTVGDDYADGGGEGVKHGEYYFKVIGAEQKETGPNSKNPGTPMLVLDIQLYNKDKSEASSIKYINFVIGKSDSVGSRQLNSLCTVCGVATLETGKELIGQKGIILAGFEQDYRNDAKKFLKPAFGGFGCWYNMERLSATEIKEKIETPVSIETSLEKLNKAPVKLNNSSRYVSVDEFYKIVGASQPVVAPTYLPPAGAPAPAPAAPEAGEDMPF